MKDVSIYIVEVGSFYVSDISMDEKIIDLNPYKYFEFETLYDAKRVATKVNGKIVVKKTTYTYI
ncbi:hypothetical protein BSP11_009 [Bacillus phage BSP11]|nr:hypothetical protein BSP11_009 [Bacillus phage BSP11]